jgi:hypothetical protein
VRVSSHLLSSYVNGTAPDALGRAHSSRRSCKRTLLCYWRFDIFALLFISPAIFFKAKYWVLALVLLEVSLARAQSWAARELCLIFRTRLGAHALSFRPICSQTAIVFLWFQRLVISWCYQEATFPRWWRGFLSLPSWFEFFSVPYCNFYFVI